MKARRLAALSIVLLASCSSYQKDFREASENFEPSKSPAGPWKGTWISEANGHGGPLWCLVSQDAGDPSHWNFRYRAGWGVFQFGDYTHRVPAKLSASGTLPLKGAMTLPNNFGTYAVNGHLTPEKFAVRYEGSGDRGTMTLSRPKK